MAAGVHSRQVAVVHGGFAMKTRLVLLFLLALPAFCVAAPAAFALPGDLTFAKAWNSAAVESISGARVAVAPSGDVYVAASADHGVTDIDFVIARYTSAGARKWTRFYATKGPDWLNEIATDRAGNVFLCGKSTSTGSDYDFLTVKFSRAGKRLWVRRVGTASGGCEARDLATDGSGNVYVTGSVFRQATGWDWYTVKYSPSGVKLWERYYSASTTKFEEGEALAWGPDGRLYVAGEAGEIGDLGSDLCVRRYSTAGHLDWTRRQGTPGLDDLANDIAVRKAGVCVVGEALDGGSRQGLVWKLTLAGVGSPLTVDAGSGASYRYKRAGIDKYGNLVAAGSITSMGNTLFWVKRYRADSGSDTTYEAAGGTGDGAANGLAVTADGTVYVTGTVPTATTMTDVFSLCISSSWVRLFAPYWDVELDSGDDLALVPGAFYVGGVMDARLLLLKYER